MTKPKDPSLRKGKASKLKAEDVIRIRELYRKRLQNARELADFYGVGTETIRRAIRGETWNELHLQPRLTEAELEAEGAAALDRVLEGIKKEKERLAAGDNMLQEISKLPSSTDPYSWIRKK